MRTTRATKQSVLSPTKGSFFSSEPKTVMNKPSQPEGMHKVGSLEKTENVSPAVGRKTTKSVLSPMESSKMNIPKVHPVAEKVVEEKKKPTSRVNGTTHNTHTTHTTTSSNTPQERTKGLTFSSQILENNRKHKKYTCVNKNSQKATSNRVLSGAEKIWAKDKDVIYDPFYLLTGYFEDVVDAIALSDLADNYSSRREIEAQVDKQAYTYDNTREGQYRAADWQKEIEIFSEQQKQQKKFISLDPKKVQALSKDIKASHYIKQETKSRGGHKTTTVRKGAPKPYKINDFVNFYQLFIEEPEKEQFFGKIFDVSKLEENGQGGRLLIAPKNAKSNKLKFYDAHNNILSSNQDGWLLALGLIYQDQDFTQESWYQDGVEYFQNRTPQVKAKRNGKTNKSQKEEVEEEVPEEIPAPKTIGSIPKLTAKKGR